MSGSTAPIERDRRGRRVSERDRHGATVATLRWVDDGLAEARVCLPDRSWLRVVPRTADDPRWGASDVVYAEGSDAALTGFAALPWAAIDRIPPLAEPARLPPGGGTAVLNLIAGLAADQQRGSLAYRGPYPTEQLFLALLESFRFEEATEHPLQSFMAGGLVWMPDPHARTFDPCGVYVQSRERVEKVAWRGRAYYRGAWQGVARHATHRVRDEGGRVVCSLWALGRALEDHLVLSPGGEVLAIHTPVTTGEAPRPLAAGIATGLVAIVIAASAAPLAAAIREEADQLAFEWAPLDGDLAAVDGGRARIATALLRALAAALATAPTRAEQVQLGFAALAEAALALGDGLRAQGQARLAAAGAHAKAEALARTSADAASAARRIGEAVEQLLEEAAQLRA